MSNLIAVTTPAEDMATLLSSLGYGTINTDIFVWKEPDDASRILDNIIVLYDTGHSKPPEVDYNYEYPTIQVRVRRKGGNQRAAQHRVLTLMNALHGYVGTVGSIKYLMVKVVNGPLPLGEDDRGRLRWTFNCEIQRTI
jgi:hypothetical protein